MNDNQSETKASEPHDEHIYSMVVFYADTFRFLRDGVAFVLSLLDRDVKALESDDLLKSFLPENDRQQFDIYAERERANRALSWLNNTIKEQGEKAFDYHLGPFSHYVARYLKSCGLIYLQQLKQKRNTLSTRPNITNGELDRLDTVVMEATKLLEERIRRTTGAPPDVVGVQLAEHALGGDSPRLRLSSVESEQKSAYLLFRGVFGFIRNQAHHKLLGEINPDRVLQTLGFVDYLLDLIDNAQGSNE